ncbi:MAG: hypothetical protein WCI11_02740 [Candidatus Methylumidiphilus sp.]
MIGFPTSSLGTRTRRLRLDSGTGKLLNPGELDRPAPQALVPKLGIKSWRDAGRLGVIYEGMNMRLHCPSWRPLLQTSQPHLPPHDHIIDVGYFPSGDVWLVEINPGLTPQDLAVLQKE